MNLTAAAVCSFLLVAAIGCGGSDSTSFDVKDSDGNKVHVEAGAKGSIALPAAFPKDVPAPKDSEVLMSVGQGKTQMVTFSCKGTVADTTAFYEKRLKEEGWTMEETIEVNGTSAMLAGKKEKEKRSVAVVISGEGEETTVQIHSNPDGE